MKTRTYHLVCFFVLLATLGVADAAPCQAALLTAHVQSATQQAAQQATAQPHARRAAQPTLAVAPQAATAPTWQATLPPAHTAALQTHTTRA